MNACGKMPALPITRSVAPVAILVNFSGAISGSPRGIGRIGFRDEFRDAAIRSYAPSW